MGVLLGPAPFLVFFLLLDLLRNANLAGGFAGRWCFCLCRFCCVRICHTWPDWALFTFIFTAYAIVRTEPCAISATPEEKKSCNDLHFYQAEAFGRFEKDTVLGGGDQARGTIQNGCKCEKGLVVLGGWMLGEKADPKEAAGFSLDVTPDQAPWLFKEGESSWASTSAELLASLVALGRKV